ncbi:MAG: ion channel [Acidimicrobiales bacterium]
MDPVEVALVVAGAVLMLVVLLDVLLTILHPDVEGLMARRVQRTTWFLARRIQRGGPAGRVLALAGPVMIAATFLTWITVFVGGYSLIVWAALDDGFRADPGLLPLTYVDAVYFAGNTVTVLGYGDLTPITRSMQLLSLIASASGFVLLTGIVSAPQHGVCGSPATAS